jgi:hypothetical protein
MPKFGKVEVWPSSGWPELPWDDDPDLDSFARITRGICEAYSQELLGLALTARASVLRLSIEAWHPRPKPALNASLEDTVEVSSRFLGSQEYGWIGVPDGFAKLPTDQQRRLGLRIVHQGVMELAQARGWDPVLLARAVRQVEDRDLRYRWEGPWKLAPDRRHRARAVAGIADDGFGRVHLEVATRAGEVVTRGEDVLASCDGDDLVWTCKKVRWDGSARVIMTAIMDPFGMRQCQAEVDLSGDARP